MAESKTPWMNADEPSQQDDIMLPDLHLFNDHGISYQHDDDDVSSIAQSFRFSDNVLINPEVSGRSYTEGVEERLAGTPRNPHRSGNRPQIGWKAISTLLASAVVVLVFLGFITFLWFSTTSNMIWHRVMVNGWANKAIAISSTILRTACGLQAGIAAAMLAALVLESSSVLLVDAAQVSIMRAGSAQPRNLLLPILQCLRRRPREASKLGVASVILLVTISTMLQFTSTVLLSDLHLGSLPGLPFNNSLAYDMDKDDGAGIRRITTWLRNPPAYPTFGEFSDSLEVSTDVEDTGILLRAFLPFADAQSRETLSHYNGDAIVLDSRVSCQRPKLSNISLSLAEENISATLNGSFTLMSSVTRLLEPLYPVPFSCGILLWPTNSAVTICQLAPDYNQAGKGGLVPEFVDFTEGMNATQFRVENEDLLSAPYIVIETSKQDDFAVGQLYTDSTDTLDISGHGAWTDVISQVTPFNFSISVCYPAFTTAILEVNLSSRQNRSEPISKYIRKNGYYTTPDIHSQMGERPAGTNSQSVENRGILSMAGRSSWQGTTNTQYAEYVAGMSVMNTRLMGDHDLSATFGVYEGNAAEIYDMEPANILYPDVAIASLFARSLNVTNGSVATAMSTLVTVLSSLAYYDMMPLFGEEASVTQAFFETVLYPQSYRGFTAVAVVLVFYSLLVAIITASFVAYTKYTMLGNQWQAISQLLSPETETLILGSSKITDKDIRKCLEEDGRAEVMVGIKPLQNEDRVGVTTLRFQRN